MCMTMLFPFCQRRCSTATVSQLLRLRRRGARLVDLARQAIAELDAIIALIANARQGNQ